MRSLLWGERNLMNRVLKRRKIRDWKKENFFWRTFFDRVWDICSMSCASPRVWRLRVWKQNNEKVFKEVPVKKLYYFWNGSFRGRVSKRAKNRGKKKKWMFNERWSKPNVTDFVNDFMNDFQIRKTK